MDSRLAASIAGAVATAPMTVVMTALHHALPGETDEPLPPEVIAGNAADAAGLGSAMDEGGEAFRSGATLVSSFSQGAAAGAGYVALAGRSGLPPAAEGALYGVAVWGAAYLGVLPATGLYHSAKKDPAPRTALMIAAHLVWGATLGLAYKYLSEREIEGF